MLVMKKVSLALFFVLFACQTKPQAPLQIAKQGVAVAKVGDFIISDIELKEHIERIEMKTPQVLSTHQQKRRLLEQFMNLELLYTEALKRGFDKRFEFKSRLADIYVEDLALRARSRIDKGAIAEFYEKNRRAVDQSRVRHILLKTSANLAPNKKQVKENEFIVIGI